MKRTHTPKSDHSQNERERLLFSDVASLEETDDIRQRCNSDYLEAKLRSVFPDDSLAVVSCDINETGKYVNRSLHFVWRWLFGTIKGLPSYVSVRIQHRTGNHVETIIVWSPLSWNDRFIGTGGGGIGTGGDNYITKPSNISRGMTLPKAVINGFTAATTDGGLGKRNWAINSRDGALDHELLENWHGRSTHFMTLVGKAIALILHERPVQFSYFHGGSGGGRQALVEAQEYPHDYDGIWSSCPAINWNRFVISGLWPIAVMNSNNHILKPRILRFFTEQVHNQVGGKATYYQLKSRLNLDPYQFVGKQLGRSVIREIDAKVMREIWDGPKRAGAEQLWWYFRPGVVFWNVAIPIASFCYSLFSRKPKPFIVTTYYARWLTQNPKQTFTKITISEYKALLDKSLEKFSQIGADKPNLNDFSESGGKLIIDHGIDDPLIPVDGTIDYYDRVCVHHQSSDIVNRFLKLLITPGDGHGSCSWHGPGISECDGMVSLIDWVEHDIEPSSLRVVHTKSDGQLIKVGRKLDLHSERRLILKDVRYGERERNILDFYLPVNIDKTRNHGLVLAIHGGGWNSFSKESKQVDCERFVNAGYFAAAINHTLLKVEQDEETSLLTVKFAPDQNVKTMLDDIEQAIRKIKELAAERGVNITRIALSGDSSGAHLAMLYAYSRQERSPIPVAFVINAVGPADMSLFTEFPLSESEKYGLISALCGNLIDKGNQSAPEMKALVEAISPVAFVTPESPATLSAYGEKDPVVSLRHPQALTTALSAAGVDHETLVFPNSGHSLAMDPDLMKQFFTLQMKYAKKYFEY